MDKIPPAALRPLRQPPPGGKSKLEMAVVLHQKSRTRPYYFRRCKNTGSTTSIETLPDDIVFVLLVKLPAEDIYDAARLVCRRWYRIVHSRDFIHAHLQGSPTGLLMQSALNYNKISPSFASMSRGRIEIHKCSYKLGLIWPGCNGLLMICDQAKHTLAIVNPITKQLFYVPPYHKSAHNPWGMGLGYVVASMEYKVVGAYQNKETKRMQCGILTVGVDDSWRHVPDDHLSFHHIFYSKTLVTEGFVHWFNSQMGILVTLNLETEAISESRIPQGVVGSYCFSTGRCLSLLATSSSSKLCWGVWEMKPGAVEWERLADIDMEDQKCTLGNLNCSLRPLGWIKYKEAVLFSLGNAPTNIAYNICTREIESFFEQDCFYSYVTHKKSLVWLGGC